MAEGLRGLEVQLERLLLATASNSSLRAASAAAPPLPLTLALGILSSARRGKTNQNGQALLGRGDSSLANPGHPWPLWVAEADTSGCELAKNSSGNGLDLSKKFSTWHALGIDLDPMKISLIEKA